MSFIIDQASSRCLSTYPVDRISRGDARPSKGRIGGGALCSIVPADVALLNCLTELRQTMSAGPEAPAKVVDDEALDAGGFGSFDHSGLVVNSSRSHGTYHSILARQHLGQGFYRVGGPDDGDARRKD